MPKFNAERAFGPRPAVDPEVNDPSSRHEGEFESSRFAYDLLCPNVENLDGNTNTGLTMGKCSVRAAVDLWLPLHLRCNFSFSCLAH